MKKFGFLSVFLGLVLIFSSTIFTITGNAIGSQKLIEERGIFVLGLSFVLGGIVLLVSGKEGNLAKKVLESGAVIDTKKLMKIARKMGYTLESGYKEGTRVYNGDSVLTVLPKHGIEGKGTYRGILKALSTGESSFRKRAY